MSREQIPGWDHQACVEVFGAGAYHVEHGANGWPDGRAWLRKVPA